MIYFVIIYRVMLFFLWNWMLTISVNGIYFFIGKGIIKILQTHWNPIFWKILYNSISYKKLEIILCTTPPYILEEIPNGCTYTVIMDNARFHRKKELRKVARGKVRLLFLPPYSPDYNRIEKSWANMKRFLRDNLQDFQSVDSAIYAYFNVSLY